MYKQGIAHCIIDLVPYSIIDHESLTNDLDLTTAYKTHTSPSLFCVQLFEIRGFELCGV